MKTKWIKSSSKLPLLLEVSEIWQMSRPVLVYYNEAFAIGYTNYNYGEYFWVINDQQYSITIELHWQPLEPPCLEN